MLVVPRVFSRRVSGNSPIFIYGDAGDEAAFSAGLGTELSEVGSADDVITPKRAVSFRHEVDHWR